MNNQISNLIEVSFRDSIQTKQKALSLLAAPIEAAVEAIVGCLRAGRKVLACGNGGSASDALHFAAELVNRFEFDRRALPAVALTADVATLTSIGNDLGYDRVFSRQVEAIGRPGDVLLAISTSGNSDNVLAAIEKAHEHEMTVIGLTGGSGGQFLARLNDSDILICAPSTVTARIQEVHLLVIHCLCSGIDASLFGEGDL